MKASAPKPYTVSVGNATTPPLRRTPAAHAMPSESAANTGTRKGWPPALADTFKYYAGSVSFVAVFAAWRFPFGCGASRSARGLRRRRLRLGIRRTPAAAAAAGDQGKVFYAHRHPDSGEPHVR